MAKKNTDDEELNYDYHPEPVIGEFDDVKDRREFVRLQEKNVADAERVSHRMKDRGVPESKRPL